MKENLENRIEFLEAAQQRTVLNDLVNDGDERVPVVVTVLSGPGKTYDQEIHRYVCLTTGFPLSQSSSFEEKTKGWKVEPFTKEAGGTGGDPFYFTDLEELETFAAREDVDLLLITVEAQPTF